LRLGKVPPLRAASFLLCRNKPIKYSDITSKLFLDDIQNRDTVSVRRVDTMDWKEILKFQRDQVWSMRPRKDDLIILAFSALFSVVFISAYWSLAVIYEVFFS
jgi:hypothetical protein